MVMMVIVIMIAMVLVMIGTDQIGSTIRVGAH